MAGERILHVDDSDLVLHVVHESLKRSGFQVMSAAQLSEIPALLERHGLPDLIVLDINMPEVQGDDLATFFRDQWGLTAPMVLFSDISRDEIARLIERVGAAAGLKKEDGVMSLIATIRQELKTLRTDTQVARLPTPRSGNPVKSVSDDTGAFGDSDSAAAVALDDDDLFAGSSSGEQGIDNDDDHHGHSPFESEATLDVLDLPTREPHAIVADDPRLEISRMPEPPPPGSRDDVGMPPPPEFVPFADEEPGSITSVDDDLAATPGDKDAAGDNNGDGDEEEFVDLDSLEESFAQEDERLAAVQQLDSLSDASHEATAPVADADADDDNDDGFAGFDDELDTDMDLGKRAAATPTPDEPLPKAPARPGTPRTGGTERRRRSQGDTKRRMRRTQEGEPAEASAGRKAGQPTDTPPRRLRRGPDGTPMEEAPAAAAAAADQAAPATTTPGGAARVALRRGGKGVVLKGKPAAEKKPEPPPPSVPRVAPPPVEARKTPQQPRGPAAGGSGGSGGGVRITKGKIRSDEVTPQPSRPGKAAPTKPPAKATAKPRASGASESWQRFQANLGLWLPRAKRSLKQLQRGITEDKERLWAQAARNLERELRLLVRESKQRATPELAELVVVLEEQWALYSEDGFENAKPLGTETAMLRLDTRRRQKRTVPDLDHVLLDLITLLEQLSQPTVADVPQDKLNNLKARLHLVDS